VESSLESRGTYPAGAALHMPAFAIRCVRVLLKGSVIPNHFSGEESASHWGEANRSASHGMTGCGDRILKLCPPGYFQH
jgi:hypothetical protein